MSHLHVHRRSIDWAEVSRNIACSVGIDIPASEDTTLSSASDSPPPRAIPPRHRHKTARALRGAHADAAPAHAPTARALAGTAAPQHGVPSRGGGHRYTEADVQFFAQALDVHRGALLAGRLSAHAFCTLVASQSPVHPAASWSRYWRDHPSTFEIRQQDVVAAFQRAKEAERKKSGGMRADVAPKGRHAGAVSHENRDASVIEYVDAQCL